MQNQAVERIKRFQCSLFHDIHRKGNYSRASCLLCLVSNRARRWCWFTVNGIHPKLKIVVHNTSEYFIIKEKTIMMHFNTPKRMLKRNFVSCFAADRFGPIFEIWTNLWSFRNIKIMKNKIWECIRLHNVMSDARRDDWDSKVFREPHIAVSGGFSIEKMGIENWFAMVDLGLSVY